MTITDEEALRVEALIGRWMKQIESHYGSGDDVAAVQAKNWLFGLQIGLATLGLYDLADLAETGQKPGPKEE